MARKFLKYRSAEVPALNLGYQTKGKHKGYDKMKTLAAAGKRKKGSIDWRKPNKVYNHR